MIQHVLTDAEMHALISGNPFALGLSIARLKDFIRQVEKAVLAKLHEQQEPIAWRVWLEDLQTWSFSEKHHGCGEALYAYPCVSPVNDKASCVSEKAECNTQDHTERVRGMVECESCGQEAIHYLITDNLGYPNKIPLCGGCTQDIPNIGKMAPEGWQLVPKESTEEVLVSLFPEIIDLDGRPKHDLINRHKAMLITAHQLSTDSN